MVTKPLLLLLLATSAGSAFAQEARNPLDPYRNETAAQRDQRMKWWREARFGMFIHWGLYAEPAGVWKGKDIGGIGEWIMNSAKIPVSEYSALAKDFNPTDFDARRIARLAKAAGMKYIVITSKHHDGFAMFRSKASSYNIYDATPFKRDPIAELAAACKKEGLKFGLYYSQAQDWYHPGGGAYGGQWDPAQKGDQKKYVMDIAAPQVDEILTKYTPTILWWDTPVTMSQEEIAALTRSFSKVPGLIANNRLGNGVLGDTETPEQFIPATGYPGRDWETCMTLNDTWGFKSKDLNFKSTDTLVRNLIDIASKGGNFLLNIGPDAKGNVPQPEIERLEQVGGWLKKNGASIYGSGPSPYRRLLFNGRATIKKNHLYLHVFEWPPQLELAGLQTPVKSAKVLATGEKLRVTRNAYGSLLISTPKQMGSYATTIDLELNGSVRAVEPELRVALDAYRGAILTADDAVTTGSIQAEGTPANLGYWTNAADTVSWKVSGKEAGVYTVKLDYACDAGSGGSTFVFQVDGQDTQVKGTVEETGSWNTYRLTTLTGTLSIAPGNHVITLKPIAKPGLAVMNLRRVTLVANEG